LKIAEGRQTFDNYVSQLEEQWQWLSEHEPKFKDLRDKRLAHLDVSKHEDKYGPTQIQPVEWDLALEALRRLIKIAKLLSAILRTEGRDFEQFERLAKRDAKDFWQTS
jgi:HEPN superfamily AbiU2-like protein